MKKLLLWARNGMACTHTLAVAAGFLTIVGCGERVISVPCPKPPADLVPAAETVSVGGTATFAVPASQRTGSQRFQWTGSAASVASVPSDEPADAAHVTAVGVGTATIDAVDVNSQTTCRDVWEGRLVVR